jgi:GT2 family glycosyltransferase
MATPKAISSVTAKGSLADPRPFVAVVVPHYNDLASLDLCLRALCNQTYPAELVTLIVADNNSSCGSAAVEMTIAGRARLVVVKDKGAGPARNGGAALAIGEVLAFTDCDCEPDVDWLKRGIEGLAHFDIVGGQMLVTVSDEARLTAAEAFERVFAFNNKRYIERKGFSVTANLFCRRITFLAVGGFGAGMSEDVDWCCRAVQAGFKLGYCPLALCNHPARRNWDELRRKWIRTNSENFILTAGTPGGKLRYLIRTMLLPASILPHAAKVLTTRRLKGWRERSMAIGMLVRLRLWRFADSLELLVKPSAQSGA